MINSRVNKYWSLIVACNGALAGMVRPESRTALESESSAGRKFLVAVCHNCDEVLQPCVIATAHFGLNAPFSSVRARTVSESSEALRMSFIRR
jgi:hypothetical protein